MYSILTYFIVSIFIAYSFMSFILFVFRVDFLDFVIVILVGFRVVVCGGIAGFRIGGFGFGVWIEGMWLFSGVI